MKITEDMKKTVAFVRYRIASGEFRSAGTAFLIGHEETSHGHARERVFSMKERQRK
jgi:hypothetical protein